VANDDPGKQHANDAQTDTANFQTRDHQAQRSDQS
jgi:hypothetical protein